MKSIICDSSSLISLSENCMLPALQKVTGKVQLMVPNDVYHEVVSNPMSSRKYAFKAFILDGYFRDNLINVYRSDLNSKTMQIMNTANEIFELKNHYLKLIQLGESAAVALCNELNEKTLMVDERTTRLLIEDPMRMKDYMEDRMSHRININTDAFSRFQGLVSGIKVIRSAELAVYAYEKGWFDHRADERTLSAMLFSLKYAGCSITEEEIQSYKEMMG